jgi:hypothetical protein
VAGDYHRYWDLPSTRRRRPGPTHLIHPAGPSFRFTSPGSGPPVRSKSVSLRRSAAQIQISWVVHGPKERKGALASWCRRCTRQWMGEPRWWVLPANLNDITKQAIAAAVGCGWMLERATASVLQMPAEIWPEPLGLERGYITMPGQQVAVCPNRQLPVPIRPAAR